MSNKGDDKDPKQGETEKDASDEDKELAFTANAAILDVAVEPGTAVLTSTRTLATAVTDKPQHETPAVLPGVIAIEPGSEASSSSKQVVAMEPAVAACTEAAAACTEAAAEKERARAEAAAAASGVVAAVEPEVPSLEQADLEHGDTSPEYAATEVNHGLVQPPNVQHHTTTFEHSEEGLPVAFPITRGDLKLSAVEVDPAEPPVFYKRPAFRVVVVILLAAIAFLVVVLSLGLFSHDKDESIPTAATTSSPTMSPTSLESMLIREEIIEFAGSDLISYSPAAFDSALDWFVQDELKFNITNTTDTRHRGLRALNKDRFVLAWFYYHSTLNGASPWLSGNPPGEGEADTGSWLRVKVVQIVNGEPVMCYAEHNGAPRWLSAIDECEWPGISCVDDDFKFLWDIDLLSVGIKGTFPSMLQLLPTLESLQITYGAVTGPIPENFDKFKKLWQLAVIGNLLEDPLPDSMFTLDMWILNLGFNRFRGPIPGAIDTFELGALYLMNNQFEGPLPDLSQPWLEYFRFENNNLTGTTLPASWGNFTSLLVLYGYQNGLEGTIPQEWSGMTDMENFRFYGNNLEGELPSMADWSNLRRIFMQNNSLTGTFPEEW